MTSTAKSPLEMLYHWEREAPEDVFLRQPDAHGWLEYSWREVADQVRRIAAFLISKRYPPGSRIAIWSANSKDWPIVDLAIMLSGHVGVPIYPGQDLLSAQYILQHSDTRLIFVGKFDQSDQAEEILPASLARVGMLGCRLSCETSLEQVVAEYPPFTGSPIPKPDDLMTIIYTSGTTGNPKGVMHVHQTPGHVVPGLVRSLHLDEPDSRLFSFLPMSHAAERILVEMTGLYSNTPISFSHSTETFSDEIRSVQPTFFFAVPRLWIKFKEKIDAVSSPEEQLRYSSEQKEKVAYQLGLSKARIIFTGSAPAPRDVQQWFLDMGIVLRDAYGMTENFVHGTAWLKDDNPLPGCVGQKLDPKMIELRLSAAGEVQFRSKGLMKGYYLEPEKTREVFDDKWYCTGDSGRFDSDGNLWITGRISEVFKTSKGKFIVPTRIENLFGRSSLLSQLCVYGHGKDQPELLATLSQSGEALDRDQLYAELQGLMREINASLPPYERLSRLTITPEWTIENGLLTPTMKIKRKHIEAKYTEQANRNANDSSVVILG